MRDRCYRCFRPATLCFCQAIPRIDNVTEVLILQHVGERFHPFNTARIVRQSLVRCQLIVDHNRRFSERALPIQPGAGLLFPDPAAPDLAQLPTADRPRQIVIVDGTWHQAKTLVRDLPQLAGLPRFRLNPERPGEYRIRLEPDVHSLSTLEATVAALRALEPETTGLDQLLAAFHGMVDQQLDQMDGRAVRLRSPELRPRFVPHLFWKGRHPLVVAYGEATPRLFGQPATPPRPVSWFARRLSTEESFACYLQPPHTIPETARVHMRVTSSNDVPILSEEEFRVAWRCFLNPNDILVVFHAQTRRLLESIDAVRPQSLTIKAIFRAWRRDFRNMEELLTAEAIAVPDQHGLTRAEHRLEMTRLLVEHLRRMVE